MKLQGVVSAIYPLTEIKTLRNGNVIHQVMSPLSAIANHVHT